MWNWSVKKVSKLFLRGLVPYLDVHPTGNHTRYCVKYRYWHGFGPVWFRSCHCNFWFGVLCRALWLELNLTPLIDIGLSHVYLLQVSDKRDTVFTDVRCSNHESFPGTGYLLGGEKKPSRLVPSNLDKSTITDAEVTTSNDGKKLYESNEPPSKYNHKSSSHSHNGYQTMCVLYNHRMNVSQIWHVPTCMAPSYLITVVECVVIKTPLIMWYIIAALVKHF